MRRLLFVLVLVGVPLVGCRPSKASGPRWPEPSKTAEDGGESLAPKPSATYAAALESKTEPVEDKPAAAATVDKPAAATEDKPATTTPATTSPTTDEVFTTEEIVIEIEE